MSSSFILVSFFSLFAPLTIASCVGPSRLLEEKRKELGEQVSKLRNGLFKISDTRVKVEAMSVELEEAKIQVAEFQKQCDEYLAVIVQQKREANKQKDVSTKNIYTNLID